MARQRFFPHPARTLLCVVTLLMMMACTGHDGLLPKSGGRAYEVLVVGDRQKAVTRALSTDVDCLPQSEPEFDVSNVDSTHFNTTMALARNIVMVHIDPRLYTATRIRYERNVHATPQLVVHVGAPSAIALQTGMQSQGTALRRLLNRTELQAAIARLQHHRNVQMEKQLQRQFGATMWIPADMTASKRGRSFLWMSNNTASELLNIVVYRARRCHTLQAYTAQRDSIMGANIKGETDRMAMQTVPGTVRRYTATHKGRPVVVHRGLWEMAGDDMGGPFVSHTVRDITVEVFVYAPGTKKRNKLRQLEAALYTLKY